MRKQSFQYNKFIFAGKKAVFLPLFVIATFVILGTIFYTITNEKINREDLTIGRDAAVLMKIYDEGDKINFFLETSLKYSEEKALNELYDNAGYRNSCPKIGDFSLLTS